MRGTTKWFNAQKGYGFITGDDGAEYFAHQTQIKMDGFRTLDAGDIVEFDVRSEEKGLAAVVLMGAYLQEQKRHGDEIKNEESDGDLFSNLMANADKRAVVSYSFSRLDKETNEYVGVDSFE